MSSRNESQYSVDDFYFLKIGPLWRYFWSEHPAFWFICGYLFFEYFRPQSIYPVLDILPWAQVCLLGALAFQFVDGKSKLKWSWTHTWLVLFALQIHLSFLFAYDVSWSKNFQLQMVQWVVIFFLVTQIVTTKERFYVFFLVFFLCSLKISLGTSLVFAARGFAFTRWGLKGPPGYFENSGELAIQMVILFCISIFLTRNFWVSSNKFEKAVLFFSLTTPALTVMGASSRGSQLALVFVLLFYFRWSLLRPKIMAVFVSIFATLWYFLPEEQIGRFQNMGEDQTSVQRMLYWTNGLQMIKDYPLVGVGYFNFIPYYTDFYPNDIHFVNRSGDRIAELPHNIFIQFGTDAGIPALIYFLAMFLSLRRSKPDPQQSTVSKNFQSGLILGVVGYLIAGQFVTVGYYPFFWISAALIVSLKRSDYEVTTN